MFRTLGDKTRLSILCLLMDAELNVTEICKKLRMAQPSVSHHLGILRGGGMVNTRRDGKQVYYSLRDFSSDPSGKDLKSMLNGSRSVRIGEFVFGLAGKKTGKKS